MCVYIYIYMDVQSTCCEQSGVVGNYTTMFEHYKRLATKFG